MGGKEPPAAADPFRLATSPWDRGRQGTLEDGPLCQPMLHYLLTVPPELFPVYIHTGGEAAHHTPHGQKPCQT